MNLPADFVPISLDGMSIITALILFPLFGGCMYLITKLEARYTKRVEVQDGRLDGHDALITSIRVTLAEFKGDMRETRASVKRIDDGMSEIAKMHRDMLLRGYGGK